MAEYKYLNVQLPAALVLKFKTEASKRGVKLYAAIKQAIELWMKA